MGLRQSFRKDLDPITYEASLVTFYEAFNIDMNTSELISLVGAGGKTSTMFRLAQELKGLGKRVLVTTTTNLAFSETSQADRLVIDSSKDICCLSRAEPGTIVCLGSSRVNDQGKLKGIEREFVGNIYQKHLFDYIVVEADGSKRRPIKAPAHYEPVIPGETTRVIGVIGLDALGKTITEDFVHRPNLFCSITGKKMGDTIDRKCLIDLILSQDGLFKDVPHRCKKYVVFNKADHTDQEEEARIVGDTENGPESDILGQASAGIGMDSCLDFFRRKAERRELGIGYCFETQDYFDLCFFSNR
jgi:probable selenium-dependent hydroxylase accessory protein YqeC